MIIFVILLLLLALPGAKLARPRRFFSDYLSREQTSAVNGLFVILVFLSHASTYISLSGPLDSAYLALKTHLGQLVVATFLFYSGFGMAESIRKKGASYVRSIPSRRFARVLFHMVLAVLLYAGLDLLLHKPLTLKRVLLACIGWTSIGNSNWYIFVILCLYLIVCVSFLVCRANVYIGTVLTTVLSAVYVYVLVRAGKDMWCTTVALFPLGMWVSLCRPLIEKLVMKNDVCWLLCAGALTIPYILGCQRRETHLFWHYCMGCAFMLLLVLLTMKLQCGNRLLRWLGAHVFSIYILQRIPMIVFASLGLTQRRYLFVLLCLAATLPLAVLFDAGLAKLDALIWSPGAKGKVEPQ